MGGGSDLPGGPGATVSATIDKYVYVLAKRPPDSRIYLSWREKEVVERPEDLRHEIVREAILESGLEGGIEVSTVADVAGVGSGLGSSAATCVAVLHALLLLRGREDQDIDREDLARRALSIQVDRLGKMQGGQDEFACALGGLRYFKFGPDVPRVPYSSGKIKLGRPSDLVMAETFHLFSPRAGGGRSAESVLRGFADSSTFRARCCSIAGDFENALRYGQAKALCGLLVEHDRLKREVFSGYAPDGLPPESDGFAWKLCGAGGTGHVLVACERSRAREASIHFERLWGPRLPFSFVDRGTEVLYEESRS